MKDISGNKNTYCKNEKCEIKDECFRFVTALKANKNYDDESMTAETFHPTYDEGRRFVDCEHSWMTYGTEATPPPAPPL